MRKLPRTLFYALSPSLRLLARRIWYLPHDLKNLILGRRKDMVPPKGLIYTGTGDFLEQGMHHLHYLTDYAGLQPSHRVLDIGCGIGRSAVALTHYLSPKGSYEGLDIVKQGIRWCQNHISSRYPNFRFRCVSLRNELYRSSPYPASAFIFPFPDQEFDCVFAISLFTHLSPEDAFHYLDEIHRVMKKEGTCLATFFLYDREREHSFHPPFFNFPVDMGTYRLMTKQVRVANVAWDKEYFICRLEQKGIHVVQDVMGYWRGNVNTGQNDFQDILVMKKIDSSPGIMSF